VTITRPLSTRSPRRSSTLLIASGVALAWGCGDPLDDLGVGGEDPSFPSIYADFEPLCGECHAPGAPGRTEGIEATQDWSTLERARTTLRGVASGLIGNFADCNGVPLLGPSADQSLLVASLDEDVRRNFSNASFPACTADAISLQTSKIGGPVPAGPLQELKDWIDAGAPGN
jgi:hypothetical protein